MKKIILICTLGVLLTACSSKVTIPPFVQEAYMLKYNEIAGPNFLITESNSVSFDYVGIGSLVVYEKSGGGDLVNIKIKDNDAIYDSHNKKELMGRRNANIYSALERAVAEAKAAGGDAIINLKTHHEGDFVTVTGMVVKRK